MDGYVVDVLNKTGENIAAGYPVVVVRTGEQRVSVGLSQDDVKRVQAGTKAYVTVGGLEAQGEVVKIEAIPDAETRTYTTEILLTQPLDSEQFYLGATARVELEAGEAKGIWVPIASVLNDGEDYIFIVEENRALKKNIKLLDVQGFNVRIEGVSQGEQLVVTGMKSLKEGTPVRLQSEEEAK
jgi:multidrug efflux pump subunit AcrA (membrane-fusion protein)